MLRGDVGISQDSYRLPEGMRRVGYDADEGRYYFRDAAGKLWAGPEGAQFGELKEGEQELFEATPTLSADSIMTVCSARRASGIG